MTPTGPLNDLFAPTDEALRSKLVDALSPDDQHRLRELIRLHGARTQRSVYMSALEQSAVAISVHEGMDLVFTFVNDSFLGLVSGRDVLGKTLFEALPDVRDQGFDELLRRVMTTGEPFRGKEMTARVATPSGERVLVLNIDYSPMRDVTGRVFGVLSTLVDVTSQVSARQQYRAAFEALDDGFCIIEVLKDRDGRWGDYLFVDANAAFADQTGLVDVVGKTILSLAPGLSPKWFALYGGVVDTGQSRRMQDYDPALKRWFDVHASRVSEKTNQVAVLFKDITARKRGDAERERLIAELSRSNTALDQFASVASHDLRVPLRGIAMLSEWIDEDLSTDQIAAAREKLRLMRARVQHLDTLINGIREYSMAGKRVGASETIDLVALFREVVELISPAATVTIVLPENPPPMHGERVQLQQVLLNLMSNAIKHSQRLDVTIRVAAVREGGFMHFSISDDGVGIEPEFHQRIWEIFQTLKPKDGDNTGIGLSVVKRLVESGGGRAYVESNAGPGVTFHVLWPTAD